MGKGAVAVKLRNMAAATRATSARSSPQVSVRSWRSSEAARIATAQSPLMMRLRCGAIGAPLPSALSMTRAFGMLGLDRDQPIELDLSRLEDDSHPAPPEGEERAVATADDRRRQHRSLHHLEGAGGAIRAGSHRALTQPFVETEHRGRN